MSREKSAPAKAYIVMDDLIEAGRVLDFDGHLDAGITTSRTPGGERRGYLREGNRPERMEKAC